MGEGQREREREGDGESQGGSTASTEPDTGLGPTKVRDHDLS